MCNIMNENYYPLPIELDIYHNCLFLTMQMYGMNL